MVDLKHCDIENTKVGVMGLGFAGFPIMYLFSKKYNTVGYDISGERIKELQEAFDRCGDFSEDDIREMLAGGVKLTTDLEELRSCNFYVAVVPTPVDTACHPDFTCLKNVSREVASVLSAGDVVVFESTVYPGATEEICVPIIEKESGLKYNEDFFVGYSPERINPGDPYHIHGNLVKVTSGSTPEVAAFIDRVYDSVLEQDGGKTFLASSIRVAEACKVIENAQRDVNVAFMNEVAQVLDALHIDTDEVIKAMDTKWNALGFKPGLVGGHCIGIDPYYLIDRAVSAGCQARLMETARTINNGMSEFVTQKVLQLIAEKGMQAKDADVLLLGFTFKENCHDVRNTRVFDIRQQLLPLTRSVEIYDPWADPKIVHEQYGIDIYDVPECLVGKKYHAIVLCVAHNEFFGMDLTKLLYPNGVLHSVKGALALQSSR